MPEQNYSNHVRRPYAYMALMVLNLALIVSTLCYGGLHFHALHCILLGLAIAVTSATMAARVYALRNQDRIIRLEETLRLQRLAIDPTGLTLHQLIALRFAPDEELPTLAARARTERLAPRQIKQAVQQWRADHYRI